ncbi:MAG: hypothetical protein U1E79_07835 [Ottowia sp.]
MAKLSGIGCSSKTPDYFLGASHGFNTVHGRMPGVAASANLADATCCTWACRATATRLSIGLGQLPTPCGATSTWSTSSRTTASTA